MRIFLTVTAVVMAVVAVQAQDWYYRGEANAWGATAMTDEGGGIYSIQITGTPDARTTWKHSTTPDSWDWPLSGDSWGYYDGSGNLTITLDTNTSGDGWLNSTDRIKLDYDPGHQWQAVGDFNGWNNADATWNMSALGGGIYSVQGTIATPGSYVWKALESGTWDAIGADARSVNADNIPFETVNPNTPVTFKVDVLSGTTQFVPEPGTLALLAAGGIGMALRRRRRG